jgi:L-alanine-DL-glutamate epimerase-like enolase superfamily enzyme
MRPVGYDAITNAVSTLDGRPPVKVSTIETIRLDEFSNIIWVRVHTDEGIVGLGETFFGAQAVEAYLHETVAPYLIGKDPLQIDRHARGLYGYLGYRSSGVETRGNSAIDIALWDIFGSLNAPNALIQETVRAYYTVWYTELVTDLPIIAIVYASLPGKPGLGTELLPGLDQRPDAHVRVTTTVDL